jgi:hypothetical protein
MNKIITLFLVYVCIVGSVLGQQQIDVPRIEQMPDKPAPYQMKNWKQTAIDYDNFVFDVTKTGTNLPLVTVSPNANGVNYPAVARMTMKSYVGANAVNQAEAINIIPAIVGASLVGVDKTNHFSTNWITKVKDFFNLQNGQNVYLNAYSANTGNDWWYETMPNVFFYQLYDLYPNADSDFATQFTTVADRWLNVLYVLGGQLYPWQAPNMNHRSINLITNQTVGGVNEPESAGAIAWILHQAYRHTGERKYLQGAELALSFLQNWTSNPSYEIQLPYGIAAAARINAEEGTNYNIDKFLNWVFSSAGGTLRGWGTIVGNWNGYEMSGLVGEANGTNDYAFLMNGFQHAAALAPVAKYDKRYARAIAKWILNLANASRYFYPNALPAANQHAASLSWANQYDNNSCIPFESIKQNYSGTRPYAMGDAVGGGWATTNLSLYSGSSVGYLASIIETTNVEGVLQIDLNKTDFRGQKTYPNYLYYNPNTTTTVVNLTLPAGSYNIYDAISEQNVKTSVSGTTTISIAADAVRLLVIYPSGSEMRFDGHFLKVRDGGVLDYHHNYNYPSVFRIKSFSSDITTAVPGRTVNFACLTENASNAVSYVWYDGDTQIAGQNANTLAWTAATVGIHNIKCTATDGNQSVTSGVIRVNVVEEGSNDSVKLLVYYPLNDGNTANAAQNAYHAVSVNATSTEDTRGKPGHAFKFENPGQYIYTPNDAALNVTDKIAVSLWIKPDVVGGFERFAISHGSWEERWKMSITPEGHFRWTLKTGNGIADVDDPQALTVGEFVHYTGIYTGSSLELYRNGSLAASKPLTGNIGTTGKAITLARKDAATTDYAFAGTIDEVRIYNAELSPAFIAALPTLWTNETGVNELSVNSLQLAIVNERLIIKNGKSGDKVQIFDISGKIIFNSKLSSFNSIDISNIAQGIYIVQVNANVAKFIKR